MLRRTEKMHKETASDDRSRRAFSLLEMLLVLVLLVTLAALSFPALRGALGSHRLREGAKSVRIELAKARLRAMEAGRTCVVRYAPGERRFRVAWQGSSEADEQAVGATHAGANHVAKAAAPMGAFGLAEEAVIDQIELPEGIVFAEDGPARGIDPAKSVPVDQVTQSDGSVDSTTGESWSEPVIFYPDGRTSDSRLLLRNEREAYVMVTLRGLTGVVKISELAAAGDLQ